MTEFLLKLLGVKIEGAAKVVSMTLHFRNGGTPGWIFLLALAFSALAWWSYRYRAGEGTIPALSRRILTGLRITLFLLILLLLLRPVITFTMEASIRRMLVLLLDTSTSMNIQDPRVDEADIKRAALAKGMLDFSAGLDQAVPQNLGPDVKNAARIDLLKSVLQNKDLNLLAKFRQNYDLSIFGFGGTLGDPALAKDEPTGKAKPVEAPGEDAWVIHLTATNNSTAIGDAVREVISRKRGQPLAGIFLATDGANNSGSQPVEAANFARQEGVPLYIYGIGITSPRDIIVSNIFTQDVAFVKDEVSVTVRVRGQGLDGQSAKLYLKLGDEDVAEKEVQFAGGVEQTVSLSFTPQKTGEFELKALIPPRDDEAVKDNNSVSQRIRVIDSKIKVLLVEQSPRWEFHYIQNVLLRDRRVDLKCVLFEGDPSIAGENSPYIAKFPATKEELFKYDLVVFGDVDPKLLTSDQIDNLAEFVSKFGGALISIAGKKFNPYAYRDTPIEKLLPVELEAPALATSRSPSTKPALFELTADGRASTMLHLSPKEEENTAIWKAFPPLYWVNKVARAKPGAQVLLVDSDPANSSHFGKMPLIAQQQFGLGQVLYVGTDDTWRWRKNNGGNYYPLLWGEITQKMALTHLLGGSKRTQLTVDKLNYTTGEHVNIYGRLYNENFEPVKEAAVDGAYAIKDGTEQQDLPLRAVPEQPGIYHGDFVPLTPGLYQFSVKNDPKTVVEFSVTEPKFELGETAMNEAQLKQMAEASGGAFFREENLHGVVDAINQKAERIQSTADAELWSSPFYFLLIFIVVTAEWLLRKRNELK